MLKTFKLTNGLQAAAYSLPNVKSVHLRLSAKGGSMVENKKNNGIAHFLEHLLVQGIPSFPNVESFAEFIEGLAGSYSAYTEGLTIGFSLTVPFTHLEDALKISSEVFFEPLFTPDSLERERGVIIDEIKQRMDSHYFKIGEFFRRSVFRENTPLTLETAGSLPVIQRLKRGEIVEFWRKYFTPQNIYLLLTGDFQNTNLAEDLEKYFGRFPRSKEALNFPALSRADFLAKGVKIRFDQKLKTNYVDFVFPAMDLTSPLEDRIKQNLSLVILGNLRNSRLFKLLRYQKGLVYNIRSGSAKYPGVGYVYISSEVPPANLSEVVSLISRELTNFIQNGPSESELDFAKNYLINQWLISFDHPSSIANWVEDDLLWEDKVMLPEEAGEVVKKVKAEDLIELMEKYWDFASLSLLIQGPTRKTPEIINKFAGIIKEIK